MYREVNRVQTEAGVAASMAEAWKSTANQAARQLEEANARIQQEKEASEKMKLDSMAAMQQANATIEGQAQEKSAAEGHVNVLQWKVWEFEQHSDMQDFKIKEPKHAQCDRDAHVPGAGCSPVGGPRHLHRARCQCDREHVGAHRACLDSGLDLT